MLSKVALRAYMAVLRQICSEQSIPWKGMVFTGDEGSEITLNKVQSI